MNDRTLPLWLRLFMTGMALMQLVFGVTLLINPAAIGTMWPWAMTSITARLLGASALVSVPLALLSVFFNRYSAARLPMIMILAYRVLQVAAGLVHFGQFDFADPVTWNYFGGGILMMILLAVGILRGPHLGQPITNSPKWLRGEAALNLTSGGRGAFRAIGIFFFVLGVAFFVLGKQAGWLWLESEGLLTGLTARLFASPVIGLALAAWIIAASKRWREVGIPAAGMATFGIAGTLTMALEFANVQPPTGLGYLAAAVPLILLAMGIYLLSAKRGF